MFLFLVSFLLENFVCQKSSWIIIFKMSKIVRSQSYKSDCLATNKIVLNFCNSFLSYAIIKPNWIYVDANGEFWIKYIVFIGLTPGQNMENTFVTWQWRMFQQNLNKSITFSRTGNGQIQTKSMKKCLHFCWFNRSHIMWSIWDNLKVITINSNCQISVSGPLTHKIS
jgi:hypothetical protein